MEGLMTPMALQQMECYEAALMFARTEGLIVAPETSHAVAATIRKALEAKEEGKEKTIIFNLSGHGLMDLYGYQKYLAGELSNTEMGQDELEKSLAVLKGHPTLPYVG
jgi:tryptophan synthase beta chain